MRQNRVAMVHLLDGRTEEQARRRMVPSRTTVLGLVKHATCVERVWFDVAIAGRTRAELELPEVVEDSFALSDQDTVESVLNEYRRADHQRDFAR